VHANSGDNDSGTESERNAGQSRTGLIARADVALTSSRPGHTRMPFVDTWGEAPSGTTGHSTPLVRASALHGVSGLNFRSRSHLGSTLNPGGAVLTLGVFRRSGSVAYVRVDASPSEVLTGQMVHCERRRVKLGVPRHETFHLSDRSWLLWLRRPTGNRDGRRAQRLRHSRGFRREGVGRNFYAFLTVAIRSCGLAAAVGIGLSALGSTAAATSRNDDVPLAGSVICCSGAILRYALVRKRDRLAIKSRMANQPGVAHTNPGGRVRLCPALAAAQAPSAPVRRPGVQISGRQHANDG
jgi:hypothetical protein